MSAEDDLLSGNQTGVYKMPKPITLFKKALGLNNTANLNRLQFNPESGEVELAAAYNVDIGNTGDVSRRQGFTDTIQTAAIANLFCDGGDCFCTTATQLHRLHTDYTSDLVVDGLTPNATMAYCQIANRTYWSNNNQLGYVIDGVNYSWAAGTYVGPPTHRQFSNPPVGNLLTYLSSRIFVAQGNIGWYSEPFAYGWFDLAKNFIDFGSTITMWKAVDNGIYVGMPDKVVFLAGTDPKDFSYRIVSPSPVIVGTDTYVWGNQVGGGEVTERVVMWTSQDGIYVGQPDGKVINITKDRVVSPDVSSGNAVFANGVYLTIF
jgi:hypothetical protein